MNPVDARSLALLLVLAGPAIAGDGPEAPLPRRPAGDRARLDALGEQERRLMEVQDRIRRGEPVAAADTAPTSTTSVGVPPGETEIAFERARLDAVRARVQSLKAGRVGRAPAPSRDPTPSAAPAEVVAPPAPPAAPANGVAPVCSTAAPPKPAPAAVVVTDPLRLADAFSATGDSAKALEAYGAAATLAERQTNAEALARARYGIARSLERLGRTDEALAAYASVASLPEGGSWAKAAAFGRRFLEWRRKVASTGLPSDRETAERKP